jgi:hypothetical protein
MQRNGFTQQAELLSDSFDNDYFEEARELLEKPISKALGAAKVRQ